MSVAVNENFPSIRWVVLNKNSRRSGNLQGLDSRNQDVLRDSTLPVHAMKQKGIRRSGAES